MDNPHRAIERRDNFHRRAWILRYNRGHDTNLTVVPTSNFIGHVTIINECRICRQNLDTVSMEESGHASATCRYSEV